MLTNETSWKLSSELAGPRRGAWEREWIVLLAGAGLQNQQIAAVLKITPEKAARWRNRFLDGCLETTQEKPNPFLDGGLAALYQDARRPGRPPTITHAP